MTTYNDHQNLYKRAALLLSKETQNCRMFPRHVGKFVSLRFFTDLATKKCKPSDWKRYMIAINFTGMSDAYILMNIKDLFQIHIEVEFKTGKAKLSKPQKGWKRFINFFGGYFIECRDEVELIRQIKAYEKKIMAHIK